MVIGNHVILARDAACPDATLRKDSGIQGGLMDDSGEIVKINTVGEIR
jgi:hypothetical protein